MGEVLQEFLPGDDNGCEGLFETLMIHDRRSRSSMTAAAQITISEETLALLRKMGHEGESDDEIIRRLIRGRVVVSLDAGWNRILEEDEFFSVEKILWVRFVLLSAHAKARSCEEGF